MSQQSPRLSIRPSMGGDAIGVGSAGSAQQGVAVAALRVTPDGFKQKMGQITEEAVCGLFEIWREAGYDEGIKVICYFARAISR